MILGHRGGQRGSGPDGLEEKQSDFIFPFARFEILAFSVERP